MSELRADQIANRAGTGPVGLVGQSAAKAWVNYKGTTTREVRHSFNISSATNNGTGDDTFSFSNNMLSASFKAVGNSGGDATSGYTADWIGYFQVSSFRFLCGTATPSRQNRDIVCVDVHGDLA